MYIFFTKANRELRSIVDIVHWQIELPIINPVCDRPFVTETPDRAQPVTGRHKTRQRHVANMIKEDTSGREVPIYRQSELPMSREDTEVNLHVVRE